MGPVVPYLSDSPAQLAAAVRQIAASGASHVTPIVLHLRPGTREWFMGWLRDRRIPNCCRATRSCTGAARTRRRAYAERIVGQVRELARQYGVGRAAAGNRRPTPTDHPQLSHHPHPDHHAQLSHHPHPDHRPSAGRARCPA